MAITLHQLGHYEGDVRDRKIERETKIKQIKMVEEEQKTTEKSWGELGVDELWQTVLRGWEHAQPKTDSRNSNTHRLQLKQASPELRVEDFYESEKRCSLETGG